MNILTKLYQAIFVRSVKVKELEVLFHKETNKYGTHGTINVSSVEQNLKNANIRFLFLGLTRPPELTPEILYHLWHQAEAKGYMPHRVVSYGSAITTEHVPLQTLVTPEQQRKEIMAMHNGTIVNIAENRRHH